MEELCGPMSELQAAALTAYGELILESSRQVNLISRQSLSALHEHFIDSAALLAFADPSGLSVADLGTGAGFPGVVVALLRESADVTLVDSRRSKVVFLKHAQRELGLGHVRIAHARLEEMAGKEEFDLAVARALGDVRDVLPHCLRLVRCDGRLVLFKGPRWSEEAEESELIASAEGFAVGRTEAVELPGLGRATTFVEFHVEQTSAGTS